MQVVAASLNEEKTDLVVWTRAPAAGKEGFRYCYDRVCPCQARHVSSERPTFQRQEISTQLAHTCRPGMQIAFDTVGHTVCA
jgi:hypothetical protein